MTQINIMLDLETMGTTTEAPIVAIAAVPFTATELLPEPFYCTVNLESSVEEGGGVISASTVLWWLQQSDAARAELTKPDGLRIGTALRDLSEYLRQFEEPLIWGNPAAFDNAILRAHYLRTSRPLPWNWRQDRCYRTLSKLYPDILRPEREVEHNALHDATAQAEHALQLFAAASL